MDAGKINAEYRRLGWKASKWLVPVEGGFLQEDLAQYLLGDFCIDFGFYNSGTYRIYIVKGGDWENPYAKFATKDQRLALSALFDMAGIFERSRGDGAAL